MADRNSTIFERVTTALTSVLALLAAWAQLSGKVNEFFANRHLAVTQQWIWLIVGLLAVAALVSGRRSFRRSKLLRRIVLRRDQVEHLKGREEEIAQLAEDCSQFSLVFLLGESGAGKSALVLSGLIPRLRDTALLPIYVNAWGRDWEDGPRSALAQAMREHRTLADAAEAAARQGRLLLVIFDQFDDYQNTHRPRFRSATTRAFLSAAELADANSFWREIRDLLVAKRVHCLFVTRSDAQGGLESIRFVEPLVYQLDRLHPESARQVLDAMTSSTDPNAPVVAAPESGWPALRDRLVRDLSREGAVLPIQMSLALKGLGSLPYLTVREYERQGGLRGLEAAEIEWHTKNAAQRAGIRNAEALAILCAMVDREAHKTRACTRAELRAPAGLLEDWQTKDLVRRSIDADTGEEIWSLDHDYLSNGVLAAEARASRASTTLRDAHEDHRASGRNIWRRFRTLLTPAQQIALLADRLRGRFRYGERRAFALLSLVRFVPYAVLALIVGLVIDQQIDARHRDDAAKLLAAIGGDRPWGEGDGFWSIAQAPRRTRVHLVADALRPGGNIDHLSADLPRALHAAIGLDDEARAEVLAAAHDVLTDPRASVTSRLTAIRTIDDLDDFTADDVFAATKLPAHSSMTISENSWNHVVASATPEQADALSSAVLRLTDLMSDEDLLYPLDQLLSKGSKRGIEGAVAYIDNVENAAVTVAKIVRPHLNAGQRARVFARLRQLIVTKQRAHAISVATEYGALNLTTTEAAPLWGNLSSSADFDAMPGTIPLSDARNLVANRTRDASTLSSMIQKMKPAEADQLVDTLTAREDQFYANQSLTELETIRSYVPKSAPRLLQYVTNRIAKIKSRTAQPAPTAETIEKSANVGDLIGMYQAARGSGQDTTPIAKRIESVIDTYLTSTSVGGIAAANAFREMHDYLPESSHVKVRDYLLRQLETTSDPGVAAASLEALFSYDRSALPAATAKRLSLILETWLDAAPNENTARPIAQILLQLPNATPQTYVTVAAKPTCYGTCLDTTVALAKKNIGADFHDDLWSFAKWARARKLDLSPVRFAKSP
jgi:hypothetical protein